MFAEKEKCDIHDYSFHLWERATLLKKSKQQQTAFRTTPELKKRLEDAAKANGRTFNKEVNHRLERSLSLPEETDETHVPGLLAVAAAMNAAGQIAAFQATMSADATKSWWDNPYAFEQAIAAADRIFEALRPSGKIERPLVEAFGAAIANGVLSEIANDRPISSMGIMRQPKLRRDLGSALTQRVKAFLSHRAKTK